MKLELIDLHVSFEGKRILSGVSLVISPGEVHALMGPNGSGKSTLSSVLAGHPSYKVEQGDILVDGKSILSLNASERAKLGLFLSFQNPIEVQGVSVSKLLFHALKSQDPKLSFVDFKKRVSDVASKLNVEFALERDINVGFSGGEKKRLEVLQLLLLKPKLAILDELDSGLDIDSLNLLASAVNDLRSSDFSALVITHYPRILGVLKPDFVHVLSQGKIVMSGSKELASEIEKHGYGALVK
ncbi:Fe-S cluster assembly ATPase SufC [Candidatus Woesearchaeota archaeon]|nr:Fe-S cluster assembly ATPase SufC [Candidatus Woesearchaeota archaeon]